MRRTDEFTVPKTATIRQTIEAIDRGGFQVALVLEADGTLFGLVSDGDVRRGILRGLPIEAPVVEIANRAPLTLSAGAGHAERLQALANDRRITRIPMLDADRRPVGLLVGEDFLPTPAEDCDVLLMAGGLGTRLRPHTETVPKPMIDIGGRPLIEHSIRAFAAQGFRRFFLSVNYLADRVKAHFGDGSALEVEISYLEETERLGTAGCLRLLPPGFDRTLIVMNGDILTRVNFARLLSYHRETGADATMCLREYRVRVPFGVAQFREDRLVGLQEKPEQSHMVNAGLYALSPSVLPLIPPAGLFDMTALFDRVIVDPAFSAAVFPLHEYWIDVGTPLDLERARAHFARSA